MHVSSSPLSPISLSSLLESSCPLFTCWVNWGQVKFCERETVLSLRSSVIWMQKKLFFWGGRVKMMDLQARRFSISDKSQNFCSWPASSLNFQSLLAKVNQESEGICHERSCWFQPTRYRSVDTLTRIRSSPMRTFSPSDLCLDAGWIVHQQASPAQTEPRSSFN